MSAESVEIQGSVRADGTLVLDDKVNLPAGRVRVTVQPVPDRLEGDSLWTRLEAIWAGQRKRGNQPRSKEAIDADIAALRDEAEEELLAAERLHEEIQKARENPGE
jgi:hypothetical protein